MAAQFTFLGRALFRRCNKMGMETPKAARVPHKGNEFKAITLAGFSGLPNHQSSPRLPLRDFPCERKSCFPLQWKKPF